MKHIVRAASSLTLAALLTLSTLPASAQEPPTSNPQDTEQTNDSSKDPQVEQTSTDIDNASGYTEESANESSEIKNFSGDKIGDEKTQEWFDGQHEWVQRMLIALALNGAITLIAVLFIGPVRGIIFQLFGV
ncbi:MAG: hypothetical protein SPI77_04925 [Corynebacterium sp.]|nr:hypothetical protein [Corynebacterium sp.]